MTPLPVVETPADAKRQAWLELVRAFHLIYRQVTTAITAHDVTMPQFDVLATLRFSEGVTQQELAERLLVTKGNVCGVLDRLERLGWVERRPDPDDRRANRIFLTSAGRRKIASAVPAHDEIVLGAMESLGGADVKALRGALQRLAKANEDA